MFPASDALEATLGGAPEDAVVRGEGAFPFPFEFEPDDRGLKTQSILGEGLAVFEGCRLGRPAVSDDVPDID